MREDGDKENCVFGGREWGEGGGGVSKGEGVKRGYIGKRLSGLGWEEERARMDGGRVKVREGGAQRRRVGVREERGWGSPVGVVGV